MLHKLTVLLLTSLSPVMLFAQLNNQPLESKLQTKAQSSSVVQDAVVQQQNVIQGQRTLNKLSATNNFYVNWRTAGNKRYISHTTSDPAFFATIKSNVLAAGELFEGTTDDKGYWWAINSANNLIYKIDPANGDILLQVPAPAGGNVLHGIAYCPLDKLIYFITVSGADGNLYSMTTAGDVPVFVRTYAGIQPWGLACTSDGTLYSFDNAHGLPLVKFYTSVPGIAAVGASINVGGFWATTYIEIECDNTTNNVYLLSLNGLNANHAELRLVNVTLGNSTLVYDFNTNQNIQGLAFNCGVSIPAPASGKFVFTMPRTGENWIPGSVHYISWKRTGIVYGSFFLEYSTDGGDTWNIINYAPFIGSLQFPWRVPDGINSTNCLLRISNYNSKKVIAVSTVFSIVPVNQTGLVVNYPNPFNPSTKISFSLEKSGFTSLKVYNSLGQQVADLISKELQAGLHEFEFNASNLPSGVYYYNLKFENSSSMKKMLLLK